MRCGHRRISHSGGVEVSLGFVSTKSARLLAANEVLDPTAQLERKRA